MVEPGIEESYRSPYVEERFCQKPQSKHIIAEILRIESVLRSCEEHFETIGVVGGWSRAVRQCGNRLAFIELNDGSTPNSISIVVEGMMPNFEQISKTLPGASYRIRGKFCKSPSKNVQIEIQVNDPENHYIKILGNVESKGYPISGRISNNQHLREIAHLRPRTKFVSSITRISNSLVFATHLFFQSKGFLNIQTPILTTSKRTEQNDIFQVTTILPRQEETIHQIKLSDNKENIDYTKDFFKKPTFLSASGQLLLEAYACSMSNVYTFNPAFRALYGRTWRHLTEFWMIEPEMAFANIDDAMDLAEAYLKFCVQYISENNQEDLDYLEKEEVLRYKEEDVPLELTTRENLKRVLNTRFKRITYDEAIKICAEENKTEFWRKTTWGDSLSLELQRYLSDCYFQQPVIIYNFPKEFEGFHVRLNDDKKTAASMEILIPKVGEIIKGSQKEERLEILDERLEELKIDKNTYWWYRDLRKYGTVPRSGFGLGFERLVMLCTGALNIRDAIPFPRDHGNASF